MCSMFNVQKGGKMSRTRNWTFIVYPESCPKNWIDILNDYHIPCAISPIHNLDVNSDGEIKKEHYHIMLTYDSPKDYKQVEEITNELCATIPKKVESKIGMYEYLIHKNDLNKAQYKQEDIIHLSGFDINEMDLYTINEQEEISRDILNFICNNGITEYSDLLDYCRIDNINWYKFVRKNFMFYNTYITSKRNKGYRKI